MTPRLAAAVIAPVAAMMTAFGSIGCRAQLSPTAAPALAYSFSAAPRDEKAFTFFATSHGIVRIEAHWATVRLTGIEVRLPIGDSTAQQTMRIRVGLATDTATGGGWGLVAESRGVALGPLLARARQREEDHSVVFSLQDTLMFGVGLPPEHCASDVWIVVITESVIVARSTAWFGSSYSHAERPSRTANCRTYTSVSP